MTTTQKLQCRTLLRATEHIIGNDRYEACMEGEFESGKFSSHGPQANAKEVRSMLDTVGVTAAEAVAMLTEIDLSHRILPECGPGRYRDAACWIEQALTPELEAA